MQYCLKNKEYLPGWIKRMKRRISFQDIDSISAYTQLGIKTRVAINFVIAPCALIAADMGWSDLEILFGFRKYLDTITFNGTDTSLLPPGNNKIGANRQLVEELWWVMVFIYVISCISLIFSPFLSAIHSSYQTALTMADIDQERDGIAIPLGKELNSMSDPTCSCCFCFSQYNAV